MEETVSQGILSPIISDMMTFLSIFLSVIVMVAVAYLWSTKKQDGDDIDKLEAEVRKLSKEVKELEGKINELKPPKKVESLPKIEPFGINPDQPRPSITAPSPDGKSWSKFVENYNHIAASMAVPGQRKACEKFVDDNGLKMLMYGGMMTFMQAVDVEESNYWAWKIPETQNQYAVVPNPMKPCDDDIYSRGGLKETFASNYKNGTYKKYAVTLPAIFLCSAGENWHLKQPGTLNLERQ